MPNNIKMPITIKNSTIDFLKKLSKNNNREWLNKNKNLCLAGYGNGLGFVDVLLLEMRKHDLIETRTAKESLFRISYKTYWPGHFKRATKKLRGATISRSGRKRQSQLEVSSTR